MTIMWYDLETDGLGDSPVILEAAFVLTDDDLNPLWDHSWVVKDHDDLEMVREKADPFVQKMHDDNGLWAEVEDARIGIEEVQVYVLEAFHNLVGADKVPGAGAGVSSFDLQILKRRMPWLVARMEYWSYDVSPVRRFYQRLGVPDLPSPDGKPHRAMADVERAMAEWKYYENIADRGIGAIAREG